jgi:hypothetical protein
MVETQAAGWETPDESVVRRNPPLAVGPDPACRLFLYFLTIPT